MLFTQKVLTLTSFFHENVGISAWGLAIHEKSRLIAVSSNLRQVTVFIPAIAGKSGDISDSVQKLSFPEDHEQYPLPSKYPRLHNSRRVLKLGAGGHNIPSIDFVSETDGAATSILGIDILGMRDDFLCFQVHSTMSDNYLPPNSFYQQR